MSYRNDRNRTDESSEEYCEIRDDFGCIALENDVSQSDKHKKKWIRLQAGPDTKEIAQMTPARIMKRIQAVEEVQANFGQAALYPREWVPAKSIAESTFTVAQFNTLAQGLSFGPSTQSPFRPTQKLKEKKSKDTYGGFSSVSHPEICLDFQLRQWRLLQAILQADTHIVGLQEMDRFNGFFLPLLKQFGYQGIFQPKAHSPGVKMGWYTDGCALLWRSDVFELESSKKYEYKVGNQACMVVNLVHKATNRVIRVAVTHLKAQKDCEDVREQQMEEILQTFLRVEEAPQDPTLLIGDFNTEPSSGTIAKVAPFFSSAYDLDDPNLITTYKTRGTDTVKRVIDYIYYSGGLKCLSNFAMPSKIDELPSLRYPSDHVLLASQFDIPPVDSSS